MTRAPRRDLLRDITANLKQYRTLSTVYGTKWVQDHLSRAMQGAPHPMLNWLSAPAEWGNAPSKSREHDLYSQCEAVLTRMDDLLRWASSLGPNAGKIKSRFSLLRGKVNGSWDDNHRDWWTTLCEFYLAHWMASLGYGIRMAGHGADIELTEGDASILVEVTSLRKGLGVAELEGVISWYASHPHGVVIRYTTEDFKLTQTEFGNLLSDFDQACSSIAQAHDTERVVKHENSTGLCEIMISHSVSSWITTVGPTNSLAFRFDSLYDRILGKIQKKVSQKQLDPKRPSILVIDIETWRPSAVIQFKLSQGDVMNEFPVEEMPASVAALMLTTISPLSGRPSVLTITSNPQSPYENDQTFQTLLARIGNSLR